MRNIFSNMKWKQILWSMLLGLLLGIVLALIGPYVYYYFDIIIENLGYWGLLAIITFLISLPLVLIRPKQFLKVFFGNAKYTPAEMLKYIGIICGAFIVLGTMQTGNKTNQLTLESNKLTRKGQLDNRFVESSKLIASNNTSEILSGIYALHQIAVEASKDEEMNGYVKVINDILCAYIRENSIIEIDKAHYVYKVIKTENLKPQIVIQTIIDLLFNIDDEIYQNYLSDLSHSVLIDISLSDKILCNVDFQHSWFQNVRCFKSLLKNINFDYSYFNYSNFSFFNDEFLRVSSPTPQRGGELHFFTRPPYFHNVSIKSSVIKHTHFAGAALDSVWFDYSIMDSVKFGATNINNSVFMRGITLNDTDTSTVMQLETSFPKRYLEIINAK